MTYYNKYFDCGRQFSDFYVNTPRVSTTRNHTPSYIHLRWGNDLDPSQAVVEFYNYYAGRKSKILTQKIQIFPK